MSRYKAFAIHLGISLAILLVLLYFTRFHWYPSPLFSTDGGWKGFRLLAVLFLLLGPALTLLIFKPGKRGLMFDLLVIGLLQVGVLGWGSWTIYQQRPVALVFADGHLTPVAAHQLGEIGLTAKQLMRFGKKLPVKIYVDLPEDPDQMQTFRKNSLQSGIPLYLFTDLYRPLDPQNLRKIQQHGLQMERLYIDKPQPYQTYQSFKQEFRQEENTLIFIPLHARHKRHIVVLDASSGKIISKLDIAPPKP